MTLNRLHSNKHKRQQLFSIVTIQGVKTSSCSSTVVDCYSIEGNYVAYGHIQQSGDANCASGLDCSYRSLLMCDLNTNCP